MRKYFKKAQKIVVANLIVILVLCLLPSTFVLAQGLGLSGNFYRQHFELSPGETSPQADIYVVASNPSDEIIEVHMITQAPQGVILALAQNDFTLEPGEQQKVDIRVEVNQDAVPGEYSLTVSAEAYREGTGIKAIAGTQQQAKLTILGESGSVIVNTVTESGESFPALIDIYREISGELVTVRPSQKSRFEARLAPGDYLVQAHYQDIKVAEQNFSLSADEEEEITLVCYTLCLTAFTVSPNYSSDDIIASAKISYTIANMAKPLEDVRAVLKVENNGQPLDETELISFSTLDVSSREGNSNYIPAQGWQKGHIYSFIVELYAGDELHYQSPPQELTPEHTQPTSLASESVSPPATTQFSISWPLIGGIIVGVLVIILLIVLLFRRRAY